MLMKQLILECSDCGWTHDTDNSQEDFDKMYDLEDDECPQCHERIVDAI